MFRFGSLGSGQTGRLGSNWSGHRPSYSSSLRPFPVPSFVNYYLYGSTDGNKPATTKPGTAAQIAPKPDHDSTVTKPDPSKVLTVDSLDLKVTENTKAHHTDEYDISQAKTDPKLVVRRGQPFNIEIKFSKGYNQEIDDLRIVFEAGSNPSVTQGTSVEFILSDDDEPKKWGAKIDSQKDTTLTVTVFTPPTCYVGKWTLKIDVVKKVDRDVNIFRYQHRDPIYIIFNPWCKDDAVYMEKQEQLNEYILCETGGIYVGSENSVSYRPWSFSQFDSCVLDVALYLLDKSGINWAVRGNPIPIVRKLSALINAQDDNGVLEGSWSGNYPGGQSPVSWTGSGKILEKYWKTKTPVKYGQCWVFSGLGTTLCRTLGIPARSVTNFESAHDTDGSITIDYINVAGGWKNERDSVWNFHVWNEAWMSRPDLPEGYGGWQAFDATPQETSDGIYCCGPASVIAIKEGRIDLPYDGAFIFAEVNADKAFWKHDSMGKLQCVDLLKDVVGKHISTKAVNNHQREDVTGHYKHPEGSAAERAAVRNANQSVSNRTKPNLYSIAANDVQFTIVQDTENTFLGNNFELSLVVTNGAKVKRTVSGQIEVSSMFYTGVVSDKIKSDPFKIVVEPGKETTHKLVVTLEEYESKLKDFYMLDVSVWAEVEETKQFFIKKQNYRLRKPHLKITGPSAVVSGQEYKYNVSFVNPLNRTLTDCFVVVDGLGKSTKFRQSNVPPKSTFIATIPVTPIKSTKSEIILNFNSEELQDINVSHHLLIQNA
ncbi:hemocyte protein-glutamine gamma-glutamyltransferase-like [Physella acuta]|uniref:hemocyte protein-glutamine gamma-glutamyltransferase-like n=1 Tax=Physella acuta TaxID=109671 RepID=UPI0027DCBBA0|nr:hemocyte protein-glutamine gamma-glutamyltransferase-like [Physella acuta]